MSGRTINSTAIEIAWHPLPANKTNGQILGYHLAYCVAVNDVEVENATLINVKATMTRIVIGTLQKYTPYKIWVSAYNSKGDGPYSDVIIVKTDEDGMFEGLRIRHDGGV